MGFPAHASEDAHVLVLGRISDDPNAHYAQLKPLLDYVVPRMRDVGITEGRVLMARDAQQMASYLRRNRVDWVTETASTAVQLQQRVAARPLLLTERNGVSSYRTVFFVRKDRPISSLRDLRGHTLALQSTASTSAYMVPMTELLDAHLSPEILLAPSDVPSEDRVGYVFARSELNIASWVHKGMVDAGALSSVDWDDPQRVPDAFRSDFRVIHQSHSYPRALELVRAGMEPRVEARLREVLLQAADDPAARDALKLFFNTSRFLALDRDSERALEVLKKGVQRVRAEVE
ncbi:phosphate/phosphite/phosphonate ABC transporter substrate-binding protein [Pseudoxanthomonas daejeonensis]|uniref:Metal-binding protein n=1 Tax=Pseudoxanthomonas daejeonensis TaxID=266062 RepID=A0ABQ6Z9F8_9GAMM|nr:phosphate/phosphite/phosphonate ABC transporter substrate-binding protein [Pseudoxanthomonas daejeonensis]KAF1696296.1 metal-binding protein [Pseudoxanthomonas daejeonensis]UNK56968.1 phosphate/phosphite/phosphonate ABC transporter substrate-binding protein [Pseudoxanthomonas daejeonensis]